MMNSFQNKHKDLIELSGGIVKGIFVEKVGVMMTKRQQVTDEALELMSKMNIDDSSQPSEQHAEFNSRLTYLSFNDEKKCSESYHNKLIKELGHRSIYNDENITFLIAGCSIETMIEFIAHNEAKIARLTSSKTKAQDEVLYRIQTAGFTQDFIEHQKELVLKFLGIENEFKYHSKNPKENEIQNILNLGNKAVSFTISMSIKDWHKTFIGRLSDHGVENEMLEILEDVLAILKLEHPKFFNTSEEYYSMNNNKKYGE